MDDRSEDASQARPVYVFDDLRVELNVISSFRCMSISSSSPTSKDDPHILVAQALVGTRRQSAFKPRRQAPRNLPLPSASKKGGEGDIIRNAGGRRRKGGKKAVGGEVVEGWPRPGSRR